MITMFVREKHAIELVRSDPAPREAQDELTRAQPAIDEDPAMIGRDERTISRAAAPEHCQTEHARLLANEIGILK
jgi:hypothetical protein